jgi:hypothetical protein
MGMDCKETEWREDTEQKINFQAITYLSERQHAHVMARQQKIASQSPTRRL